MKGKCHFHAAQKSQTYVNKRMTARKKPSHTFQPTPVLSAMSSIRFMVPRRRNRVLSKLSFIFSANADDSLISSPIATVICVEHQWPVRSAGFFGTTYILEYPDLPHNSVDLLVVLALELVQDCVAVLAPEQNDISVSTIPANLQTNKTYLVFGVAGLNPRLSIPSPEPEPPPIVELFAPGYPLYPYPPPTLFGLPLTGLRAESAPEPV